MKVAIVHDFLIQMGGAEKVVEVLHEMFPEAPVFTSAYDAKAMPDSYRSWDIHTSFLQRLFMKRKTHRLALLLYPAAFESFDLSSYDMVISSSSAFAKGIVTQPQTVHICYTHTPMRFAWLTKNYMKEERVSMLVRTALAPGLHYLRTWDGMASMRVDKYIANSTLVGDRIQKFYRRDCEIIHPPVNTGRFKIAGEVDDYHILVSRFAPYKRIDLAVEAFTRMGRPLKIVGTGRQMKALQAKAGKNVEFLGRVADADLPGLVARAQAYVMPGEEDFGIAPVEANACGRPVIAFAAGGALDTQVDGVTGVLFGDQSVDGLCDAVRRSDSIRYDPRTIRNHALSFDTQVFKQQMMDVIVETHRERNRKIDFRVGDRRKLKQAMEDQLAQDRRQPHVMDTPGIALEPVARKPVLHDRRGNGPGR